MRPCDFGTIPHLPKAERCLGGDGGGGNLLSTVTGLNKERHRFYATVKKQTHSIKRLAA